LANQLNVAEETYSMRTNYACGYIKGSK